MFGTGAGGGRGEVAVLGYDMMGYDILKHLFLLRSFPSPVLQQQQLYIVYTTAQARKTVVSLSAFH